MVDSWLIKAGIHGCFMAASWLWLSHHGRLRVDQRSWSPPGEAWEAAQLWCLESGVPLWVDHRSHKYQKSEAELQNPTGTLQENDLKPNDKPPTDDVTSVHGHDSLRDVTRNGADPAGGNAISTGLLLPIIINHPPLSSSILFNFLIYHH